MPRTLSPIQDDNFEVVRLAEHAASMVAIAATKAKNLFGAVTERALATPVVVTKNDRPSVIVVRADEYLGLIKDRDDLLTLRALAIEAEQGYIGEDATARLIAGIKSRAEQ